MNWRKISENWRIFIQKNGLDDNSSEHHYFYGRQEFYQASEKSQGFKTYYENIFNKSAIFGSSIRIGHRLTIVSPIVLKEKLKMRITKRSLLNRIFGANDRLKITVAPSNLSKSIPIKDIEEITTFFPDMKLSIKQFGEYQHQQIQHAQPVIKLETKYQPEEIEHLEKSRKMVIEMLRNLKESKIIQPF